MTRRSEQATDMAGARQGRTLRLLVTGFGRYPGVLRNPTLDLMRGVVRHLSHPASSAEAVGCALTVSYAVARRELTAAMAAHQPDAILLLGLAARARWVRIERFARTSDSALHADAGGRGGAGPVRDSHRPLRSTAGLQPALATMLGQGVRARLSPSAGRYLCNAVYAEALARAQGRPVLFIHVPYPKGFRGHRPVTASGAWQPSVARLQAALGAIGMGLLIEARRSRTAQPRLA